MKLVGTLYVLCAPPGIGTGTLPNQLERQGFYVCYELANFLEDVADRLLHGEFVFACTTPLGLELPAVVEFMQRHSSAFEVVRLDVRPLNYIACLREAL